MRLGEGQGGRGSSIRFQVTGSIDLLCFHPSSSAVAKYQRANRTHTHTQPCTLTPRTHTHTHIHTHTFAAELSQSCSQTAALSSLFPSHFWLSRFAVVNTMTDGLRDTEMEHFCLSFVLRNLSKILALSLIKSQVGKLFPVP